MTQTADADDRRPIPIVGRTHERELDELASEMRRQVSEGAVRYLEAREQFANRMNALNLGIASGKVELLSNYRRAK